MIKNSDIKVHDDWRIDGAEAGPEDNIEQLWRLDFRGLDGDDNSYQAQIFAGVDPKQCDGSGRFIDIVADLKTEDERYVSFRLLIERDKRSAEDNFIRVDYASAGWKLTQERALALLALDETTFPLIAAEEVKEVASKPNEIVTCDLERRRSITSVLAATTREVTEKDFEKVYEDGTRLHLRGGLVLFGVDHHVNLIAVHEMPDGSQEEVNPADASDFESWRMGVDPDVCRFSTIKVPGYGHEYVALISPYED